MTTAKQHPSTGVMLGDPTKPAERFERDPIRLAIIVDGGIVQAVVTDADPASLPVRVFIIDYDIEGADEDDSSVAIRQPDGSLLGAFASRRDVFAADIDLADIEAQISGEEDESIP